MAGRFSDHGEEFWEHGGVTHARALYRESVHVPLLIRPPGGLGGGKRVANPVLITDLFATILEITGSPLPGDRDSIDLMKLAQGPVGLQEVLHGFYRGYEFPKAGQSETKEWETFSVRTPSFTYITTAPQMKGPVKEEVFAPQDIGEREDLTSARPELLEAARRALEEHRKASDAKRESDAVPTPGLNQSEIEALRGIGYF